MDEHDNLSAVVVVNGDVHDISLSFTYHPMPSVGDRLSIVNSKVESIKQKLGENLVNDINEWSQAGTLFEYASASDLNCKVDSEKRCTLLVNLA